MTHIPEEAPSSRYGALLNFIMEFYSNSHHRSFRHAIFIAIQETRQAAAAAFPTTAAYIAKLSNWIYFWILKFFTPSIPFDPKPPLLNHYWLVFLTGLFLGYVLSFGANWFGSWLSGTLDGPASTTVEYFWTDEKNLLIYTIWAPLYCALSFTVILLATKDLHKLQEFADKLSPSEPSSVDASRLPFSMSILFWLPLVATILDYIAVINTDYTKEKIYWYIVEIGNNKFTFNTAGTYHFVSNYFKLSLIVAAVLFYIAFCIEIQRVVSAGFTLKSVTDDDRKTYLYFMQVGEKLFFNMFCLGIVISCHHVIWRDQVSGRNALNVAFAHVALILAILFVVEAPRTYVYWASRQQNYLFKAEHVQLAHTLYAVKFALMYTAARAFLYLYIWSFYFEHQIGSSFVSDILHCIRDAALVAGRFMARLLGRAPH